MRIYRYAEDGVLLGEGVADVCPLTPGVWLVPAQATAEKPPTVPAGKRARFSAAGWLLEAVPEPEALPVPPTAAQLRAREITGRLAAVDAASIRALRAKAAGKGKAADDTKLTALDTEADTLRAELAALVV